MDGLRLTKGMSGSARHGRRLPKNLHDRMADIGQAIGMLFGAAFAVLRCGSNNPSEVRCSDGSNPASFADLQKRSGVRPDLA